MSSLIRTSGYFSEELRANYMMKSIQYSFCYSGCVVIISALGLIALAFLIYFLLFSIGITVYTLIAVTAVAALIEPIVSMPVRLSYDGERVVLRRLLTSKTYTHTDYHIEVVTGLELSGGLRLFASGGYFGFTGLFWRPNMGLYRLVQTESTRTYLQITRRGRKRSLYIAYR